MAHLSTTYLGLELKNPLIVSSCGLTSSVKNIKKIEGAGAAAVVLKSIFEEQIRGEARSMKSSEEGVSYGAEADAYLNYYVKQGNIEEYLQLIKEAKKAVKIPIIASVSCTSSEGWISFSKKIEAAGADALEINLFTLPWDVKKQNDEIENTYFTIINELKTTLSIPLSLKITSYFSALGTTIVQLSRSGIAGLVLFNRFMDHDIDPVKMTTKPANLYSTPEELLHPLRWISLMSGKVECDLALSTGVHDAQGIIKAISAGAAVTYMASAVHQHGIDHISTTLKDLETWMDENHYQALENLRGALRRRNSDNTETFKRVQFMRYYSQ